MEQPARENQEQEQPIDMKKEIYRLAESIDRQMDQLTETFKAFQPKEVK
jgi:hypothetical protein